MHRHTPWRAMAGWGVASWMQSFRHRAAVVSVGLQTCRAGTSSSCTASSPEDIACCITAPASCWPHVRKCAFRNPGRVLMGHSLGAACAAAEVIANPQVHSQFSALIVVVQNMQGMQAPDRRVAHSGPLSLPAVPRALTLWCSWRRRSWRCLSGGTSARRRRMRRLQRWRLATRLPPPRQPPPPRSSSPTLPAASCASPVLQLQVPSGLHVMPRRASSLGILWRLSGCMSWHRTVSDAIVTCKE